MKYFNCPMSFSLFSSFQENTKCESSFFADTCTRRVPIFLFIYIQLFQLRLSPEQSGKVEYECERLLGIANKFINLLAIPSSLSRS
jgi:hypothetical protein